MVDSQHFRPRASLRWKNLDEAPTYIADKAVYKGKSYANEIVNGFKILGLTELKGVSPRWLCQCLECGVYHNIAIYNTKTLFNKTIPGCRECRRGENTANWQGGPALSQILNRAKGERNLLRGNKIIEFTLTLEYVTELWKEQGGKCAYTGDPLSFERYSEDCASIDRIDSSIGYVPGNIQFVRKKVNLMKRDLSHDEFLELCNKITKNNEKDLTE